MASDKTKPLGPDQFDTRLKNQFLKTGRLSYKDLEKNAASLPDDSEWATWVPLEKIFKEDDEDEEEVDSSMN